MGALDIFNSVLALLFVLGLIGALAWLVRRAGVLPGVAKAMGRTSPARLGVRETISIDPRHRLVLIARDEVEHLLLIGPAGDLVIESRITDGGAGSAARGECEA